MPKDWYWLRDLFGRESLCWDELVYLFNDYGAYLIDYHDVYVNYLRMKCFDKKRLIGWDNFMNYRSREASGVLFGAKVKNWLAMQLIEYNNVDVTVCVFEQIAKYGDASFMDTLQDMVNVSSDKDTSNVQYVLNVLSDLRKDMENNTTHE